MSANTTKTDGHFKGDAYSLNGVKINLHGDVFFEAELLEGVRKGELIVIPEHNKH